MVIDKIENSKLYAGLSKNIAKAFAYINETDLTSIEAGKYEIDNGDIFAIVMEYDTKDKSEIESHFKYIDIHYIISGVEYMGVTLLKNQIPVIKNAENDYAFYECDTDLIKVEAGMFTIFFPDDIHMPCIKATQISKVKKVVVKIPI